LASGSQTLTATDMANASITGTATINVIAAAGVESSVINGADGAVLGGTDSYSIQRSKVNSIVVTFIGTIQTPLPAGAIQVLKYVGSTPTTAQGLVLTYSTITVAGVPKTQVTIRFTGSGITGGSLADGNYQLVVHYSQITFTDTNTTPPVDYTYAFH